MDGGLRDGTALDGRHVALVPPPDNLSGCDPRKGQPEGSLKERTGGPNRNRNRSLFQSGDGSKGPTEAELNEANFDNGPFTLDGMRYSEWNPGGRPGAKGAWLGSVVAGIMTA